MGNETELTMRFKVADDGSVTMEKIAKNIQGIEQHTQRMNSSLSLIKWDAIFNLGERAFHTAQRIYGLAKSAAEATNEIERNAKIAGLSTDTYQKLSFAAKMTDVDMATLGKGMKILADRMDDARKGSEQASSLFQSLGVSTLEASGKTKSFETILGDLADRFKTMPDGMQKVALATDLFGRSGERLIPFLNEGKTGLRAFSEEAEKLGVVLDEKLIKSGGELENRLKRAESYFAALWNRVIIGAYESIDAIQKFNKTWGVEEGRGARQFLGIEKKKPAASMFSFEDIGLEGSGETPHFFRQSEEAIKAIAKATEEATKQEAKLNAFYADDVELLKQANREAENRNKSADLMEQLGVKTEIGARREIGAVEEKFKSLMGQGYSPEEMEQARVKLEEQLKGIEEKYKAESGWKAVGEEGGVRWWSNMVPPEGIGRDISGMVEKAIEELNRMKAAGEAITAPKTMMIDYSPVQDAQEMVERLRVKLEDLSSREFPINLTINQRTPSGDSIEVIEDALVTRITNKTSRLGPVIQDKIEGGMR